MVALRQPYYVALLSAAALHGASHQQPQMFQVMTNKPMRPIRAGRTELHFYTTQHLGIATTAEVKTPTGAIRVSTPEDDGHRPCAICEGGRAFGSRCIGDKRVGALNGCEASSRGRESSWRYSECSAARIHP